MDILQSVLLKFGELVDSRELLAKADIPLLLEEYGEFKVLFKDQFQNCTIINSRDSWGFISSKGF